MGVRAESFEVEDSVFEIFFTGVLVRNRITNYRCCAINVYGPAQHTLFDDFIQEIFSFYLNLSLPVLMGGGDFNLIRNNKERNEGMGDRRLMNLFNGFIGQFQLREISFSGFRFTWSNKQHPTLVKLDRILASTNWEMFYPTCFAWAKSRIGSDHCPLLLNTGEQGASRPRYFFF